MISSSENNWSRHIFENSNFGAFYPFNLYYLHWNGNRMIMKRRERTELHKNPCRFSKAWLLKVWCFLYESNDKCMMYARFELSPYRCRYLFIIRYRRNTNNMIGQRTVREKNVWPSNKNAIACLFDDWMHTHAHTHKMPRNRMQWKITSSGTNQKSIKFFIPHTGLFGQCIRMKFYCMS